MGTYNVSVQIDGKGYSEKDSLLQDIKDWIAKRVDVTYSSISYSEDLV